MSPSLFEYLEKTEPGKGNEIQITDGIREVIKHEGAYGVKLEGTDFDTGHKLGYLQAMTWYGLKHENLNTEYRAYLETILKQN
jgi:UTP--glucose-1-phosphate uridylyltransferase